MNLSKFDKLVGQDSYVRCIGKGRIDPAIVSESDAEHHVFQGGQVGWWVREGYIVVDIDEGKEQAKKLIKKLKMKTLMCETPKGLHLYFKTDKVFPQRVGMILPCGLKCDYRCANKGYVLLPFGSEGRKFNKCEEIIEMPLEFTPIPNRKDSLLNLKEGDGRNSTIFSHLMAYKNHGASDDQVETMAHAINNIVFQEPMDEKELADIIQNTKRYKAQQRGDNPYIIYTAKGVPSQVNYRAIVDYFVNKGDIFVLNSDCYQFRDGVYTEASSHVRNTIKEMISEDNLITQSRIMECYKLLTDDVRLQKEAKDLNADVNLINFKNGCWDVQAKKLIPHDSKYLQTIQIPHSVGDMVPFEDTMLYDFFQKCKMEDEDIEMITKYLAYCFVCGQGLKTFMLLCGQSNTGKSVLIRFFETCVGVQNTSSLSMHELNMRFYPSQLYGRLLNSCADNSSLPLSSIENLKKITGGDHIMHEKKGKEPFFFVPFAKLIFSFNQLPLQLEEKSNAFYKRMRILSMKNELFLNNAYVNKLCSNESVEEVLPYLLNLLPLKSIPTTKKSNKMVETMRQDSDSIHAFVSNKCQKGGVIEKKELYEYYVRYCVNLGREAHKPHSFIRHMKSLGYKDGRDSKNREATWMDISLKSDKRGRKKS